MTEINEKGDTINKRQIKAWQHSFAATMSIIYIYIYIYIDSTSVQEICCKLSANVCTGSIFSLSGILM
jgi:hypothetical protein